MIKQLLIENVSFFDKTLIEFSNGFNVITGETGAGKTLLVETLLALTGEKIDVNLKDKSKNGSITGIFEISDSLLEELRLIEIEAENPVVIRKMFKSNSKSTTYLNDSIISSQTLKKIGNLLFDLHGQHEHQLLLKKEFHIKIIDIFAGNEDTLFEYKSLLREYENHKEKYASMKREIEEAQREREFLEFTCNELKNADLYSIDEDALVNTLKEMENSEFIKQELAELIMIFDNEEAPSINMLVSSAKKSVHEILKKTARAQALAESVESIISLSSEFQSEAVSILNSVNYDEEQLQSVRSRYDELERLKRKYKMPLFELINLYESASKQLKMAENPETTLVYLQTAMEESMQKLLEIGSRLFEERKKYSKMLEKSVNKSLKKLNMPDSEIDVRIEHDTDSIREDGFDSVEIYLRNRFAPEGMPLKKIASGGEVSRVMLAVKNCLNEFDPVGTLVFDEIDQGISGETASMVAEAMASISKSKQLITITHLPQIASKAHCHIKVLKEKDGIKAKIIERDERINEIARLLGSSVSKETALKHAKALLKE